MLLSSNVPQYKHCGSEKAAPCSHEGRSSLGMKATQSWETEAESGDVSLKLWFHTCPQPVSPSDCSIGETIESPFYVHHYGLAFLSLITQSEGHREWLSWALSWEMCWYICLVRALNWLEMSVLRVNPEWDWEGWHLCHTLEKSDKRKSVQQ